MGERERLEELRAALRAESISYSELAELQLEAAGVPERESEMP